MPGGMAISIAIEKPRAITTSNVLIFRLEMFLTALVMTPNYLTFQSIRKNDNQKGRTRRGECVFDANVFGGIDLVILTVILPSPFLIAISRSRGEELLNDFSELYPNLTLIKKCKN
jgi:hypothetical protein